MSEPGADPGAVRPGDLVDVRRLAGHVERLAATPRNGRSHPEQLERARASAVDHLEAAGWETERVAVRVRRRLGVSDAGGPRRGWRYRFHRALDGADVVARRPAGRAAGPGLLVLAHLDTVQVSPGADDNASGVAVVLEVASVLDALGYAGPAVLALTDLEEAGRLGAQTLVRHLRGQVSAVLCLESVGCYDDAPRSQRLPRGTRLVAPRAAREVAARDHRGDVALVVHRRSSRTLARRWAQEASAARPALGSVLLADPRPDGWAGRVATLLAPVTAHLDRSDHAPFWHAGVPAVMVTDTADLRNPRYHRPGDVPGTLDVDRLGAVAAATAGVVLSAEASSGAAPGPISSG